MNAQVEEIISELNYALALPFVTIEQKSIVRDEINRIHKKALASLKQPAQEPVAFVWLERDEVMPILELHGYTLTSSMYYFLDDLFSKIAEKNTHPAPSCQECENLKHDLEGYMDANKALINRKWQGLSDDEMEKIHSKWMEWENTMDFARAIEQALKEKNEFSGEKNHE